MIRVEVGVDLADFMGWPAKAVLGSESLGVEAGVGGAHRSAARCRAVRTMSPSADHAGLATRPGGKPHAPCISSFEYLAGGHHVARTSTSANRRSGSRSARSRRHRQFRGLGICRAPGWDRTAGSPVYGGGTGSCMRRAVT